jgi:ABC-2 type transport system ATP-binding protein
MTVEDYLDFLGKIRGMDRNWRQKRISDVIGICHLEEYQSSHIGKLSKGFRQRVGIAQAILHEPKVLVMDEPTIGIDPIQVVETRNLIRSLGGEHTVLLSTHILPEVSTVCERVVIIHEGQVVAIDKPQILSERLSGAERVEADIRGPATEIMSALRDIAGIRDVSRTDDSGYSTYYIESSGGEDLRENIANTISERGWGLQRMQPILMTLEEIFLSLTNREK